MCSVVQLVRLSIYCYSTGAKQEPKKLANGPFVVGLAVGSTVKNALSMVCVEDRPDIIHISWRNTVRSLNYCLAAGAEIRPELS